MHWITDAAYSPAPADVDTFQHPLIVHRRGESAVNTRLAIFVHGLGGSRYGERSTWGKFPQFLFEDMVHVDIGLYRYQTATSRFGLGKSVSLEEEARAFSDTLRDDLKQYSQIVLIGHSMGGLLCKAAIAQLIDTRDEQTLDRLCGLILMATPQLGSLMTPRFLARFSQDAYALAPHGTLVDRINTTFEDHVALDEKIITYRRKTIPTWAVEGINDFWVDRLSSGIGLPSSRRKTVRGTHTAIVKPTNRNSDSYLWVKQKIVVAFERFKYDVFLAAAMASHSDNNAYGSNRDEVMVLKEALEQECGFHSVFYAGQPFKDQNSWDSKDLALRTDLEALRRSRYFLLYYPEKIATSALYEAGWALILGKPSIYITQSTKNLPFLLCEAHQAFNPPVVKIFECPDTAAARQRLASAGADLFKFQALE